MTVHHPSPPFAAWHRACDTRDASFDGVFFVGISSTHIYCRPICPSRRARPEHRRFFRSIREAARDGFRACRRCRPELAPGQAPADAVERLARQAAERIAAGALNGGGVKALALQLGVGERQLRRAMRRTMGISPRELAQASRLGLARRMLVETQVPIIKVAFTSGFQSLRRFNAAFRERFRMSPSEVRRGPGEAVGPLSSR
jgi:AraC family transcriptional regulator, regulatory protein of adaptative response / DNA-3-methyladenine glycosylase II